MSSRFVNPFTDLGFKIIFGQPASKDLLIILLNELLSDEHHIEDLTFLDKEDRSENIHDKGIIYDLYCRTSTGEYIIVEMQNRWHSHFLDRTLYYVCRAVSRQMENPSSKEVCVPDTPLEEDCGMLREEEASYGLRYRLPAVYGVFLMNFKEDGLESKFRTDTVVSDRDSGRVVNRNFRQIYLQFPYFTKELDECSTLSDKLMYALKNMNNWNRMPDALKEQVFSHLDRLAAKAHLSEGDRIAYDKAVDRYNVSRIVENDIREQAVAEEKAIGKAIGKAEGKAEGEAEGRLKERLEIARKLKENGFSIADIVRVAGLSAEEIDKL